MYRVIPPLLLLLLSGCGLHGPNVVLEVNVDKRDQRECAVPDESGPLLSKEEVQELMEYARMAADLARQLIEEKRIKAMHNALTTKGLADSIRTVMHMQEEFMREQEFRPKPTTPESIIDSVFENDYQ